MFPSKKKNAFEDISGADSSVNTLKVTFLNRLLFRVENRIEWKSKWWAIVKLYKSRAGYGLYPIYFIIVELKSGIYGLVRISCRRAVFLKEIVKTFLKCDLARKFNTMLCRCINIAIYNKLCVDVWFRWIWQIYVDESILLKYGCIRLYRKRWELNKIKDNVNA